MANWSYSHTELKGGLLDLQRFIFNISPYLSGRENSLLNVPKTSDFHQGAANEFTYELNKENNSLTINMCGRWAAPESLISFLVSEHNLTGIFSDSESGNSFFQLIKYENGVIIDNIQTNYISKESILYSGLDYFIEEYYEHMFEIIEELKENGISISEKNLGEHYPFNDFFESGISLDVISGKMKLFEVFPQRISK